MKLTLPRLATAAVLILAICTGSGSSYEPDTTVGGHHHQAKESHEHRNQNVLREYHDPRASDAVRSVRPMQVKSAEHLGFCRHKKYQDKHHCREKPQHSYKKPHHRYKKPHRYCKKPHSVHKKNHNHQCHRKIRHRKPKPAVCIGGRTTKAAITCAARTSTGGGGRGGTHTVATTRSTGRGGTHTVATTASTGGGGGTGTVGGASTASTGGGGSATVGGATTTTSTTTAPTPTATNTAGMLCGAAHGICLATCATGNVAGVMYLAADPSNPAMDCPQGAPNTVCCQMQESNSCLENLGSGCLATCATGNLPGEVTFNPISGSCPFTTQCCQQQVTPQ